MNIRTDWKPPKRIIEDREGWEQLRRAKLGPCRACQASFLPQLHHLVGVGRLGAGGGDDVPANLIPLCRSCYQQYHDGDITIALVIGASLSPAEVQYVVGKRGWDFLERRYHVKKDAA